MARSGKHAVLLHVSSISQCDRYQPQVSDKGDIDLLHGTWPVRLSFEGRRPWQRDSATDLRLLSVNCEMGLTWRNTALGCSPAIFKTLLALGLLFGLTVVFQWILLGRQNERHGVGVSGTYYERKDIDVTIF